MESQTQTVGRRRATRVPAETPEPIDRETVIRERLQKIAARNDGVLTPDAVVRDARNPKSPLHDEFEWDVQAAAEAHWIEQARALIRRVRIVVSEDQRDVRVPEYVRDPDQDGGDQGYVHVREATSDADRARRMLCQEAAMAMGLMRRVRALAIQAGESAVARLLEQQVSALESALAE